MSTLGNFYLSHLGGVFCYFAKIMIIWSPMCIELHFF